jgi:hypothetical protein
MRIFSSRTGKVSPAQLSDEVAEARCACASAASEASLDCSWSLPPPPMEPRSSEASGAAPPLRPIWYWQYLQQPGESERMAGGEQQQQQVRRNPGGSPPYSGAK